MKGGKIMPTNQNEELSNFQKKETLLQFKLLNGEELQGRIDWFDNFNISISVANRENAENITILKHAICYYFSVS